MSAREGVMAATRWCCPLCTVTRTTYFGDDNGWRGHPWSVVPCSVCAREFEVAAFVKAWLAARAPRRPALRRRVRAVFAMGGMAAALELLRTAPKPGER